uniref:SH2 domain-containing protein n=1 Tax=Takifugu rubripes TaxID=31033 RepID=H2T7M0_TAKRU
MSSERVPSRSEVMGWGPYQLSEYLRKMNLSGCDKVVLKNSISGSRFVNMSENDLQKFPKLHAPVSILLMSLRYLEFGRRVVKDMGVHISVVGLPLQDEEEFDDDYESPYSADEGESTEDYESPNDDMANDYEPPPSQPSEELKVGPSLMCQERNRADEFSVNPLTLGFTCPLVGTVLAPPPQISRENKPGRQMKSTPSPIRGVCAAPSLQFKFAPTGLKNCQEFIQKRSCHVIVSINFSSLPFTGAHQSPRCFFVCVCSQELDPRWYVGQVSRGQAEGCLRDLHKDGAYLVRDSMRQLAGQPFTLMVFYQEKVYNIQIRQQNQQFLLGTGLKFQEPFPSVRDIIYHYSQFPLLLIDAKKRNMNQQNQCLLSDPAGYLMMTGQNWT